MSNIDDFKKMHEQFHMEDHGTLAKMVDCSQEVASLKQTVVLLDERIKEMKEDKEKSSRTLMWVCGMAFSIIMAVAGFGIQANANIQVLQEKVQEIKKEVEKVANYSHEHE